MINFLGGLKLVPWKELIRATPAITSAIKSIKSIRKDAKKPDLDINKKIASIEAQVSGNTDVIERLSEQNKKISQGIRILTIRVSILITAVAIIFVYLIIQRLN